jgi:hypothetical protein
MLHDVLSIGEAEEMQTQAISQESAIATKRGGQLSRLRRDQRGTTAVEFGILAVPFFMFVLGIMAIGLQFFTINALDHGVEVAARKLRTGEAQKNGMTVKQFKELVCTEASDYISVDCDDHIIVHVQSGARWADVVPVKCAEGGQMTPKSGNDSDAITTKSGAASTVVLVTACYDWQMPLDFPYLEYMLMKPLEGVALSSGGALIQSVATFRTEPYQ